MTVSATPPSDSLPHIPGYAIVEQLYQGSRTTVYRAVHSARDQPVVIKVLREYPSFSELVQFRNQYTIARNLPILGVIRPLSLEPLGNSYALVMEDFGGISLAQYLRQHSLELSEVLAIAIQIAEILHDLSQHQIVHKDIKPANILIHPDSKQVKLIDFSIASLLPRETEVVKHPNVLEGTLAYLAPEQTGRMNRSVDYRSDFYALGITLFELLTGQLPFQSADPLELIHCHLAKPQPRICDLKPELSGAIVEIVEKLMSKNAENRYQSALGLKHDLELCLHQLKQTGKIGWFKLGQQDRGDRFLIPETLYGRSNEVMSLLTAFDRVSEGTTELMLVAGFSGIGKTAVINEVHKPIVRQRGYFIKGKYDQFNRNIPLSAFVQALRDLIGQLLSESDEQLAQWRTAILEAVGDSGQILIEVIPELERIIGKQPPVPELVGSAAQNRFNRLFQNFIGVFTTAHHPLVIFLDDLQWADLASLQLIQLLMNDQGYLLMFGAYRDNEVSPTHPLLLTIKELKQVKARVNMITLAPLKLDDTNQLIADTLNCSPQLAQPLTQLIDRKTQGNPFFTTQFLKALHDEGYITFNRESRHWECDITQVKALSLTDDVVEFMARQLQKLPPETQQMLQLAACIGNQFDLGTLALVSEQSQAKTAACLWKALQEGLILPVNEVYKFYQENTQLETVLSNEQKQLAKYRFLHDRVQQAAYSLIPEDQKQRTHLTIGRQLLHKLPEAECGDRLFMIVNQLNMGRALIDHLSERTDLSRLNLAAGQKAKNSTAYNAAFNYLTIGIDLLDAEQWQTEYSLTLSLHQLAAEVAFLKTDFGEMQRLSTTVLQQAKSLLEKIKIYEIQIQHYQANNQLEQAVWLALEVLQQLDVQLPKQPNSSDVQLASKRLQASLKEHSFENLATLPRMTNPEALAAMRLLSCASSSAYIAVPQLFPLLIFKAIELSITYGNAPASTFAYADYGVSLCGVMDDIETGHQFGNLALKLLEKNDEPHYKAITITIVNGSVRHWKEPLTATLAPLMQAYTIGLETGDIEFAVLAAHMYCYHSYLVGRELSSVAQDMKIYTEAIAQLQQKTILYFNQIYWQTILNLMGQTENPCCLIGTVYDEREMLPLHLQGNNHTLLYYFYFNKASLAYLFQDDVQAIENITCARRSLRGVTSRPLIPLFYFYESLILLATYTEQTESEQERRLILVTANQEKMQRYAQNAPMNYRHKLKLIEAEQARVLGNKAEAIELYDRAIVGAKENGYVQEEALANELAAKFYLNWDKEKIAQSYLIKAYYTYIHWGASAKAQHLERCYPTLLAPILQQQLPLATTDTVFAPEVLTNFQAPTQPSTSGSSSSISATLDLATVLKASQTLSSEIHLDRLLATLLQIVLESAGADKGVLLLPHDQQWFIEAVATVEHSAHIQSMLLSNSSDIPQTLIRTVKNSRESIVIVDAAAHPTLARDAYVIQQQPKSILCTPILQQGKLVAILYLENRLTVGAFTSDRVELLNLLCAQAAISLENARLYQQAQQYVQQLEQSQLQIVQSEKMATLGNLVAGIAHEINNPIGFLNGSINNAKDYIGNLLNHLALYQQYHPNPAASIQDDAEEIDLEFLQEDLPKLLKSMEGATDRIKSISTSLRTFSRADTESKISANLHEGLESTLLILKYRLKSNEHRPEIEVIRNYGELPLIECFPGQLNQVFMNILANAIDMFDEIAQSQSLSDRTTNPQQIIIDTEQVADQVIIRIRDNGKGISPDIQAKIFDHLFTTKAVGKGTGLGLAIARQIVVEKHGGSLEVQSEIGQGSEFVIRLPIEA